MDQSKSPVAPTATAYELLDELAGRLIRGCEEVKKLAEGIEVKLLGPSVRENQKADVPPPQAGIFHVVNSILDRSTWLLKDAYDALSHIDCQIASK